MSFTYCGLSVFKIITAVVLNQRFDNSCYPWMINTTCTVLVSWTTSIHDYHWLFWSGYLSYLSSFRITIMIYEITWPSIYITMFCIGICMTDAEYIVTYKSGVRILLIGITRLDVVPITSQELDLYLYMSSYCVFHVR